MDNAHRCRYCNTELIHTFVNLGMMPLSNAYVANPDSMEKYYPLHVYVCHNCYFAQLSVYENPQGIFEDYAYFSSYSESWLTHAQQYTDMIVEKQSLNRDSLVIEIASNDGYLLQYFISKGIDVLGIEPAKNVAVTAAKKGIPTISEFFSANFAKKIRMQNKMADLVVANNVLAHVPDINDFVKGISLILKDDAIATLEFPSLFNLMMFNQFDTIYHEHLSYLSLSVATKLFKSQGLTVFDVDELATHGGSLRVYACKSETKDIPISRKVQEALAKEESHGLNNLSTYFEFQNQVKKAKRNILKTLISLKEQGKTIIGYGAPAKGNVLLNYCGIRDDFLDYTVDISPHKQGKYLPGTHLFIMHPEKINETKPDYIFILPWNIKDEIMEQLSCVREWGCKFIVPIPEIEVI